MDRIYKDKGNGFDYLQKYQSYKLMMELSDGIFHDFKNILTNISGLTQLSMLEAETKELKGNLNNIYKATSEFRDALNRYQNLINGTDEKEKVPNQLDEILNKSISMVNFRFNGKNNVNDIKLVANINSGIQVLGNFYELNQSFLNIIMNGIDAMEETGGTLGITLFNIDNFAYVCIKDTGIGISEEEINRIFEKPFTTKKNGSGLGLKITKATIEDHGGNISITSVKGEGTEVRIRLPIYKG